MDGLSQNTFVANVLTFATTPPLHEIIRFLLSRKFVAKVFLYETTFATPVVAKPPTSFATKSVGMGLALVGLVSCVSFLWKHLVVSRQRGAFFWRWGGAHTA